MVFGFSLCIVITFEPLFGFVENYTTVLKTFPKILYNQNNKQPCNLDPRAWIGRQNVVSVRMDGQPQRHPRALLLRNFRYDTDNLEKHFGYFKNFGRYDVKRNCSTRKTKENSIFL